MPDRRCDRLCILQENLEKYKLEVKTVQMHSEDVGWQNHPFSSSCTTCPVCWKSMEKSSVPWYIFQKARTTSINPWQPSNF